MWYRSKEEAEKACLEKEKRFHEKFVAIKDSEEPDCWWATRFSALPKNFSEKGLDE